MNDIDQLSAVSDLDAAGLVSEDAFAELADQITTQSRRKTPSGLRWRPAGLAAAAAVTAAALAAAAILVIGDQPTRTGARPAPSPAVRPATTAAQLVAYAARHAATEGFDPQPHQWLYTDILEVDASDPGRGHVAKSGRKPVSDQTWARLDGAKIASLLDGKLSYSSGGPFFRGLTIFGWPELRYSYLESLPSSPARLTAIIKSNLKAQKKGRALPPGVMTDDAGVAVFEAVETLEEDVVVLPPRLQAGLYGVLARDPAVRFHPSVTDYAGRRGAAFSASLDNGRTEDLIVINTRTYAYMGGEQVVLRNFTQTGSDGTHHYRKGTVLHVGAVLDAGIVQHPGQRP